MPAVGADFDGKLADAFWGADAEAGEFITAEAEALPASGRALDGQQLGRDAAEDAEAADYHAFTFLSRCHLSAACFMASRAAGERITRVCKSKVTRKARTCFAKACLEIPRCAARLTAV